jgi:RHS repeat-associated protein
VSGSGNGPAAVPATTPDGQTVTLDAGGRITSLEGVTLTYDWRNRVVGSAYPGGSGTISEFYGYDSGLNRVARLHTEGNPAVTTSVFYVYDGTDLVAQIDNANHVQDAWLFDGIDHPLRLRAGGVSTYYELDLAGNVRRLRDATGADKGGYRYTAFGAGFPADGETPAPSVSQPLQWKGRWFEGIAGGAYDVRARWWSPATGTFTGVDEYGYEDLRSNLWGWPRQCPVRWSDPSGRDGTLTIPWPAAWGGAAGATVPWWEPAAAAAAAAAPWVAFTLACTVLLSSDTPIPKEDSDCDKQWADAIATCEAAIANPRQAPRGLTGGHTNVIDCARGLVSEDCGGNPTGNPRPDLPLH